MLKVKDIQLLKPKCQSYDKLNFKPLPNINCNLNDHLLNFNYIINENFRYQD